MPTIIQHTPTGNHYILLGSGFGQWASARPNRFLGDLFPAAKDGQTHLLCICDPAGQVFWVNPDDTKVIAVDTQSPADALKDYQTHSPS